MATLRLLLPLPTSGVGIPNAVREQPIQVGEVPVTVDEEVQALAIVLARPLAVPHLPPRIVRVEVQAPERLPAAIREEGHDEFSSLQRKGEDDDQVTSPDHVTAFDIAARAMAFGDRCAAIRAAWFELLAHASSSTSPTPRGVAAELLWRAASRFRSFTSPLAQYYDVMIFAHCFAHCCHAEFDLLAVLLKTDFFIGNGLLSPGGCP